MSTSGHTKEDHPTNNQDSPQDSAQTHPVVSDAHDNTQAVFENNAISDAEIGENADEAESKPDEVAATEHQSAEDEDEGEIRDDVTYQTDPDTGEKSVVQDLSSHADAAPSPMLRYSGIVLREQSKLPKVEHVLREIVTKNEKPKWYALKTKPKAEKKTAARLKEDGFETYCPVHKEVRQWSDRKKTIEVPMFNGYILVNTISSRFSWVLNDEGAVHFVKFAGRVSAVPDDQVEMIRQIEENKLRFEINAVKFEKGDKVIIDDGPFKGREAVWVKQKSKYNVSIEIKQLHSVITIELPAAFLKKMQENPEAVES